MADWEDNPFAQTDDDNPFADPSVAAAQTVTQTEYNPFDQPVSNSQPAPAATEAQEDVPDWAKPKTATTTSTSVARTGTASTTVEQKKTVTSTATAQHQPQDEPSWARSDGGKKAGTATDAAASPGTSVEELQRASETLREYEYAERERKARAIEKAAQGRPPNFPNFPQWMRYGCFKPCFHIDIKTEIPLMAQRTTRIAYYSWMVLSLTLFWNFICTMALLGTNVDGKSVSCALSALYFVLFTPCSYYCWFHQLYSGLRSDSSLRFGWFFLVMAFQFISASFFAIGIPQTGAAGIWVGSQAIDDDKEGIGILVFTSAGLWIVEAIVFAYIIKRVLSIYRSQGMTVEHMQREAAMGLAQNKAVQRAAADAVRGGIEGAASSGGSGSYGSRA